MGDKLLNEKLKGYTLFYRIILNQTDAQYF